MTQFQKDMRATIAKEVAIARRRLELGEPLSTTAAEMELTPAELTALLEEFKV